MPEDPDDPYVLTVGEGVAEAPIVGGCLTLVAASLGTPYEIETDGCIVMLEDLNEDPYMIDAHLNHLIDAGKFANAAGFVFGTDVNLRGQTIPEYNESTLSIEEVLDELIAPLGIPAVGNIPIGHGKTKVTIPLGARARLDATGKTLDILEAGVDVSAARGDRPRLRRATSSASATSCASRPSPPTTATCAAPPTRSAS